MHNSRQISRCIVASSSRIWIQTVGRSTLKLSWSLPKMLTSRDCQPWHGLCVISVRSYSISPPIESYIIVAEAEEDKHGCNSSTRIHGSLQKVYDECCFSQKVRIIEYQSRNLQLYRFHQSKARLRIRWLKMNPKMNQREYWAAHHQSVRRVTNKP